MTCHEDNIAAHKHAAKEVCPALTDAQLEGVWALWSYHSRKVGREEHDGAVQCYLTTECGVALEDAKKAVAALHKYDLCLF